MKSITCLIIACAGFLSAGVALPFISPAHTQLAISSKRSVGEGHQGKVSALRRRDAAASPANEEHPLDKRSKILARAPQEDVELYSEALLFWGKFNGCILKKRARHGGTVPLELMDEMSELCMLELGYSQADTAKYIGVIEMLPREMQEEIASSERNEPYTAEELDGIFAKLTPEQRKHLGYGHPAPEGPPDLTPSQFSSVQPGLTRSRARLPKISRAYLQRQLKANFDRFAEIPEQLKAFTMGRALNPAAQRGALRPMPRGRF